jgi:hypothetical protein
LGITYFVCESRAQLIMSQKTVNLSEFLSEHLFHFEEQQTDISELFKVLYLVLGADIMGAWLSLNYVTD